MLTCIYDAERSGTVSGVTNSAGEHPTHVNNVARRGTVHGNASVGVVATLFAVVNHVASTHCHDDAAAATITTVAADAVATDHKLGRVALDEQVRHEELGVFTLTNSDAAATNLMSIV